jgi:hypothetical protein
MTRKHFAGLPPGEPASAVALCSNAEIPRAIPNKRITLLIVSWSVQVLWNHQLLPNDAQCREPEVRTTIGASPAANFGFKAALES